MQCSLLRVMCILMSLWNTLENLATKMNGISSSNEFKISNRGVVNAEVRAIMHANGNAWSLVTDAHGRMGSASEITARNHD